MFRQIFKYILFVGGILFFGPTSVLFGQQTNPFEIQERILDQAKVPSELNTSINIDSTTDVDSIPLKENSQSVSDPIIRSLNDSSQQATIDSLLKKTDSIILTPKSEKYIDKVLRSNPFEVSHIPIRTKKKEPSVKEVSNPDLELSKKSNNEIVKEKENILSPILQKKANNQGSKTFVFWVILFITLLLAGVVNLKQTALPNLYKSILNDNFLKLTQREESGGRSPFFLALYFIFFINFALFLYLFMNYYNLIGGFLNFLILTLIVSVVYLTRHTVIAFISYVFPVSKEAKTYGFTIMLFNSFIGVLLIPLNLIIAFSPDPLPKIAIFIGLGIIVLFLVFRYIRGFFTSSKFFAGNQFHFFLYLCTCEIAPIFILTKFVSNYI